MSRSALVTGAAGGLGRHVCERLDAMGARVVGVDVAGADIDADLSTANGREAAVTSALRDAAPFQHVVLAAGLGPTHPDAATIVSVNYFGAWDVFERVLDAGAFDAGASVVFVASNSATIDPTVDASLVDACVEGDETAARRIAGDLPGNTVYASSKLALIRSGRAFAGSLRNPRLNLVAPGPFESPLLDASRADPTFGPLIESLPVPLGSVGSPGDIADAIEFLISERAAYIHGSVLFVDGGTDALLRPEGI
jgi:NAD(P)-dependent dehydrogenase (short-subunit alcohol dehydrogenase family)